MRCHLVRPASIALAITIALGACDTPTTAPSVSGQPMHLLERSTAPGLDIIGRGIAVALNEREVRRSVIEQLRASPLVEHKVSLREALNGPGGLLRREAARAVALDERAFGELLAGLPEMDFYLADRHQRQTWTETGGAASVAVSADGTAFTEYDATGHPLGTFTRRQPAERVLFAIHPAEPTSYRMGRRMLFVAGSVIEDPADGRGGLVAEYTDANGQRAVLDAGKAGMTSQEFIAYLKQKGVWGAGADPQRSGAFSTASALLTTGTELEAFANEYITDGVGSAEIEFKAWKWTGSSKCCEIATLRWTEVDPQDILLADPTYGYTCGTSHPACIPASYAIYTSWYPGLDSYTYVLAEVMETDAGSDDHYGSKTWSINDNHTMRIYTGASSVCNWPSNGSPGAPCADVQIGYY